MPTILVVDDEDDVRVVVRKMLEQDGYTVLDTGLPLKALDLVKGGGIDLVLTDVVMPVMKGTELAPQVEAISPHTKVLLMSAYVLSEVTASRRPFLAKPFTPSALAQKVRELLAQPSHFRRPSRKPPM
jgi:two-component system, cell cycle sensor histidine kinase and response regulator CckA